MKKCIVRSAFVLLLSFALLPVFAEPAIPADGSLKDDAAVYALVDKMMGQFVKRQFDAGFEAVKPYSVMGGDDFAVLTEQLEKDLPVIETSYGICVGYETVSKEKVGESLIKIIVMEKHVNYAILWHMVFYNNGTGWKLVNILYNDKVLDLF